MARTYGMVKTSIWQDEDFRILNLAAQHAYVLLLSQPQMNNCGVLPLTPTKWMRYTRGMTRRTLIEALRSLEKARFIVCSYDTDEVLVRSFIRHDRIEMQPKLVISAKKQYDEIESMKIRRVLKSEYPGLFAEGVSEGVSIGVPIAPRKGSTRDDPNPGPEPNPGPRSKDLKESFVGSASRRGELPPEKKRLVEAMIDLIGDHADQDTPAVVTAYARSLPEGALAKVLESAQTGRAENRAAYVVGALVDERKQRPQIGFAPPDERKSA
jgi:hypothetical protein